MSVAIYTYAITAANIASATTLTTAEKTYLSQLLNSGVDLVKLLLTNNKIPTTYSSSTNTIGDPSKISTLYSVGGNFAAVAAPSIILDYVKYWYGYKNIDFDTVLTQALQSVGINVLSNGNTTVVAPDTPFSTLVTAVNAALTSGTGIPTAFTNMADSFAFGYITPQLLSFLGDPNNSTSLQQAVKMMNYPVPLTDDINGQNQFEQIYWAAYYLAKFPLKSSYSSSDCQTILEALKALTAEKTNIAQAIATNFYSTYTYNDYEIKNSVLTDLISTYNLLDANYNCTANVSQQVSQQANSQLQSQLQSNVASTSPISNKTLYIILGVLALVSIAFLYKIHENKENKGQAPTSGNNTNKSE